MGIMKIYGDLFPETNIFASENGWLEYFFVSFWDGLFSGAILVSGSVWVFPKIGVPQNGWFIRVPTLLELMILVKHTYFWKHPYHFQVFPKKTSQTTQINQ